MNVPSLPNDTVTGNAGWPVCPWCKSTEIENATVTVEQLWTAVVHHCHEGPAREMDGQSDPCAMVVDCPDCGRPSIVSMEESRRMGGQLRLTPVRTKADIQLAGTAAWGP